MMLDVWISRDQDFSFVGFHKKENVCTIDGASFKPAVCSLLLQLCCLLFFVLAAMIAFSTKIASSSKVKEGNLPFDEC